MSEYPTFVTHLTCALTGDRYEADQIHGLSEAGKPLLVHYDLDGVGAALSRDDAEGRPWGLWQWRELLPVRRSENVVSLGEELHRVPDVAEQLPVLEGVAVVGGGRDVEVAG